MVDYCENSNEPSNSVEGGHFWAFVWLSASEEEFYYMGLCLLRA